MSRPQSRCLNLVKSIFAQIHRGHIAVHSTLGVGTTFELYLPAVDRQMAAPADREREVRSGRGAILVMDDEELVRQTLGRMLEYLGYRPAFAQDGGEALELFSRARESGTPFDAVILDLTISGGLGGKETMEELLKLDPQVKALVSSGYADAPIMAEFAKYGFSGVIAKPYTISALSQVLNEVLGPGKSLP